MRCLKYLAAVLLVTSAAGVAVAAPWNAGSKIYQQQDQRTVSRRAYSYTPTAAAPAATATVTQAPAVAAPATAAPAPVQMQPRSSRSYSYQPSMNNRRANTNRVRFWKEQPY